MNKTSKTMLEAVGMAAVSHIEPVTPVDTGALQDSIDYMTDDTSVYVGSTLISEMYPIYVHEGARGLGGRPYIRNGVMNNLNNLATVAKRNYKP